MMTIEVSKVCHGHWITCLPSLLTIQKNFGTFDEFICLTIRECRFIHISPVGLFSKVIEFLDCFLIQLCICDGAFSSYCEAHGGRSLAKGEEQPPLQLY